MKADHRKGLSDVFSKKEAPSRLLTRLSFKTCCILEQITHKTRLRKQGLMSKDNLTIRIAINKPTPPEPIVPKKKPFLPLLAAALLIPALSLGLYQAMKPENASTLPITSPLALNKPTTYRDDSKAGFPTTPISTTNAKRAKKLDASSLPLQPPPSQIVTSKPQEVSSGHHDTVADAKTTEKKETDKQATVKQLIHALPPFLQRAQLSMGINKREPQDSLSSQVTLSELPENRLYMFTELRGKSGKTIHHRWSYKNKVIANIPIKVGGDYWRCYSSKYVNENFLGKWIVEITDDQGKVLYTQAFNLKS